jgi:hypothetical protein
LQAAIGRDDIDVVGPQPFRPFDLYHRHPGPCREDAWQVAVALRVEMHHHDIGAASLLGHGIEERLKRLYAARGGTDRNDDRLLGLRFVILASPRAMASTPLRPSAILSNALVISCLCLICSA